MFEPPETLLKYENPVLISKTTDKKCSKVSFTTSCAVNQRWGKYSHFVLVESQILVFKGGGV